MTDGIEEDGAAVAPAETPAEAVQASEPEQTFTADPAIPSTYTVKINGVEEQVSIEEALKGYQRQADYTQKTQALASEREQLSQAQQLWNAIESNPDETIAAIAEAYGGQFTKAELAAAREQQEESSTPADPRLDKFEQFIKQTEQRELQNQIDRELATIHQEHGVQFDDQQLIQFAVERGIANLSDAFTVWTSAAARKVAQDRQIQQRKNGIAVAGGHGTAAGVVNPGPGTKLLSIAEAMEMASAIPE